MTERLLYQNTSKLRQLSQIISIKSIHEVNLPSQKQQSWINTQLITIKNFTNSHSAVTHENFSDTYPLKTGTVIEQNESLYLEREDSVGEIFYKEVPLYQDVHNGQLNLPQRALSTGCLLKHHL